MAHLQLLPLLSGVQQVSYQELTKISREDFVSELVCREPGALVDALAEQGIGYHCVPELQRAIHPLKDFGALRKLRALFKKQRYDIVHTHSSKTGFLGRVAAKLAGIPCIVHTVHGFAFPAARSRFEYGIYWILEWLAGRCCHAVIVLTESDREICIKSLGLPVSKVKLIPNAVDTTIYQPASTEQRREIRAKHFKVDEETLTVLMVGRLWRQKAPEVLLEAAIKLMHGHCEKRIEVFFVGDGELRERLERRASEAQLSNKIHFLGWRSDVPELLQGADLFVLPSRWEGLSLAILEAMASGVPIIASDIAANRAATHDGECGMLFELENSTELADAMDRLCRSSYLRSELRSKGLKLVTENHQLEQRVSRLEELYRGVLSC